MTKKEMFANIRTRVADDAEMVAFIDHEIELLDRKSASPKKPTKVQLENEGFKALILTHLASADAPMSIKQLQGEIAEIADLSNQRVSHLLSDLVKAELLTKEYVKKVPYFSIA